MPVYEPKDYEKVIKRIQQKIIANNIKMGECLSEEAITEFEKKLQGFAKKDAILTAVESRSS